MGLKTTATMSATGRLTVPAAVRRALHLEGAATEFEVEVKDNTLIFRPAAVEDEDEDAWARTPEFQARLKQALQEADEGRVWSLGPAQLEYLIGRADEIYRAGRDTDLTSAEIEQILAKQPK